MKTYEQTENMLQRIIDDTPAELMNELSGGVILSEGVKLHSQSQRDKPLYILGEYQNQATGRVIVIYYGSFRMVYGFLSDSQYYEKLRHTFAHELRHHMEALSGINTLNHYDDEKLRRYGGGMDIAEFHEPPIE